MVNLSNSFWFSLILAFLPKLISLENFLISNIMLMFGRVNLFQNLILSYLTLLIFILFYLFFSNILLNFLHLEIYKIKFKENRKYFYILFTSLFIFLVIISLIFSYFNSISMISNLEIMKGSLDNYPNYIFWDEEFNNSRFVKDLYIEKNKLKLKLSKEIRNFEYSFK